MSFAPLPAVQLTWDASLLSPDVFLKYHVYRRPAGGDYARVGIVSNLEAATFTDYAVPPGVVSEYAVTQVENQGGNEVESRFPELPVQAFVDFQSAFLHDVRNPSRYLQIAPNALSETPSPGLRYKQSFARDLPVAHIGYGRGRTFSIDFRAIWDRTGGARSDEAWRALMTLIDIQQSEKTTFLLRHGRGISAYVQIDAGNRRESITNYDSSVTLREVYVPEGVI